MRRADLRPVLVVIVLALAVLLAAPVGGFIGVMIAAMGG